MEFYLLHPISVHFPIALLMTGFALELSTVKLSQPWLSTAATALLFLGTLAAAITLGLGLLAEETVPHVPDAWEVLEHHETLGFWTLGVFVFLSLWRYFKKEFLKPYFLPAWFLAIILLMITAYHGGLLVFHFGVGYLK
ncbi:MAG: hypothetical protein A2Z91_06570 [Deltaproteobacteria bacterium GWA2_38_16]|nr:MAG: hypothetical protein A2Z91_06570 [Deltaproteobacteria bacterium GWA2_38_16]OGQ03423.1 MAG: hypothetical protein A3D19_04840 [Deltaproteobacteria bacterium RIFCSPHIGHO2_02_FULL_38_15]OGQ30096.1 MAG: hypothetical protein A3A72_06915 [Deltaproteobacteria bacterium RIFCSPLOWO2_01_FULL_38_9]HBQ21368.1 hypothetical protein [Deltaproteobacteria bacterium]